MGLENRGKDVLGIESRNPMKQRHELCVSWAQNKYEHDHIVAVSSMYAWGSCEDFPAIDLRAERIHSLSQETADSKWFESE